MSGLGGLGAFASGLAGGMNEKKDREERAEDRAFKERMLAAYSGADGASGSAPSGGLGAVPPSAGNGTGDLFSLIDRTEGAGRYDTLFGHSQNGGQFDGVDVSKMTLAQLYDFSSPEGEYGQWVKGKVGHVATPMGRHQIVGRTLRGAAQGMGLSPDTVFGPQVQDSMAAYLARNRLAGAADPQAKRRAMRAEWEGFNAVSDADLDAAIAKFEAGGGLIGNRPMGAYGKGPV